LAAARPSWLFPSFPAFVGIVAPRWGMTFANDEVTQ